MSTDNNNTISASPVQAGMPVPEVQGGGIDIMELVNVLLSKAWALVLAFLIGASVVGFATALFVTPLYQATSMIYVYSKTTSITSAADLQLGSSLTVDFQIVATTRQVVDKVIEKLELNTSYNGLRNNISVSNPTGSHILRITATNPDPQLAADIANTMADELRASIADIMNTDEPSVVDRAYVPTSPSSPNVQRNAVIGGAACAALAAGIIILFHLLDDTIKTEDDVVKYLKLNVLAEIPVERTQKKAKKETKKEVRKESKSA